MRKNSHCSISLLLWSDWLIDDFSILMSCLLYIIYIISLNYCVVNDEFFGTFWTASLSAPVGVILVNGVISVFVSVLQESLSFLVLAYLWSHLWWSQSPRVFQNSSHRYCSVCQCINLCHHSLTLSPEVTHPVPQRLCQWTVTQVYEPVIHCPCPRTASLHRQPNCMNARWNRFQEDHNSFLLGELDETTRTPSYYVDEDHPARKTWNPITSPWMKQLAWLRIVHSGDWCLRLALRTPSGARHKRTNKWINNNVDPMRLWTLTYCFQKSCSWKL